MLRVCCGKARFGAGFDCGRAATITYKALGNGNFFTPRWCSIVAIRRAGAALSNVRRRRFALARDLLNPHATANFEAAVMGVNMRKVQSVTLQKLVEAVQDIARSDEEVVAVLQHLLKSAKTTRPLRAAA
jgi:hypothetical protein